MKRRVYKTIRTDGSFGVFAKTTRRDYTDVITRKAWVYNMGHGTALSLFNRMMCEVIGKGGTELHQLTACPHNHNMYWECHIKDVGYCMISLSEQADGTFVTRRLLETYLPEQD